MGHTFSQVLIHTVFSTKDRRPTIAEAFRQRLHEYLCGIARQEFGKALSIGGTDDHVHALLSLRPVVSVSEAMQKFKGVSSRWVHETIPNSRAFGWQEGYGAFSVSQSNVDVVAAYITRQGEHHLKMSFQQEFIALLERHGIEYDPRYVWD